MNYVLKIPSLESTALVKVAATLWNQYDIRNLIERDRIFNKKIREHCYERTTWIQNIEHKVLENVQQLPLPESLKEKILRLIKVVGTEILKWLEYHFKGNFFSIPLPKEICWTPQGTLDKKKTAEVQIKDESLHIVNRYKLACIYCLEDDIPELWNKIPENYRKSVCSEEDPGLVDWLVVFWTLKLKGEVAGMKNKIKRRLQREISPYVFMFEFAANSGNIVAIKYFLQKLTPVQKEENLMILTAQVAEPLPTFIPSPDFPSKEYYADVFCFLFSQLENEQQIAILKSFPLKALKCFLIWPWQNFFMQTVNRMWHFLSERALLSCIDRAGYEDYNYRQLLEEFWQLSPDTHKKYAINACTSIIPILFECTYKRNIRLILNDAIVGERKNIISWNELKDICQGLISNDKWDLLKSVVQECISFPDIMLKSKEEFKKYITRRHALKTLR